MKISKSINHFFNYQKLNVKKNTIRNYEFILGRFQKHFRDAELESITSNDILEFMTKVSGKTKQNTKRLRFTLIATFFN
jgi:site-specific recombinase XerD